MTREERLVVLIVRRHMDRQRREDREEWREWQHRPSCRNGQRRRNRCCSWIAARGVAPRPRLETLEEEVEKEEEEEVVVVVVVVVLVFFVVLVVVVLVLVKEVVLIRIGR
jgi:hypothetical protein